LRRQVAKYIPFLLLTTLLLSSCLGTKHLRENEKLLYGQSVSVPKNINEGDLENLYVQQPNRRFPVIPIAPLVGIYYFGEKRYDKEKLTKRKEKVEAKFDRKIAATSRTKKTANLQFRKQKKKDKYTNLINNGNTIMQWGEPVSVYDSTQVEVTINKFKDYLFSQGYFTNTVSSKVYSVGKFVNISYKVVPGQPYIIDSIFYQIRDTAIFDLLQKNSALSYLKEGNRYMADNFSKERERIDLLLKDNGFYDFSRQYIDFEADTALLGDRKVCIRFIVREPAHRLRHQQFEVDSVILNINSPGAAANVPRQQNRYRHVTFSYTQQDYSLKVLSQRVFIFPNDLYSRNNTLSTQRQLANLDAFKFVNINYDTSNGKFVANIFTSPLDRYEWSNEVGVNVTQGYPGPFYNINFKKRNIFKGLENFDLNGRIGFEGVAAATNELTVYQSTEAGINASLTFPQFIWPLREAVQLKSGKYNPKTRVTIGYAYTDRPEYRRSSTNLSTTYNWQNKQSVFYSLSLVNLSIINSKITQADFTDFLEEQDSLGNRSLSNSFKPSFVSSVIFSLTWNPNNYGNVEKSSHFMRASLESGGALFNFVDPTFIANQGLAYYKYLRLNFDIRRITVLNKNTVLAKRFNSGFAYSFNNDKSLPYEKFFFAGGSNSVRAWRPRRLGPGSFKPPLSSNPQGDGLYSYQIEQPAEVLLEGSIELRKKLFGFVSGAVFIDAGNVWTREARKSADDETDQGNSAFKLNTFYKEIGVGTGFGLRFDFSFLILRFDVGMKVIDPTRDSKERFVLDNAKFFKPFGTNKEPVIYNIGIGYSF
jgi:outer membrane protein insertion porin family